MLRKLSLIVVLLIVAGAVIFWVITAPATVPASALPPHTPDLANGKVMFYAGGCASCHATPGQQDATRLGGGLALVSPFGTFFPPNISPDRQDGIGAWREADFVTALLKGTSPDGQHYYPAFPYPSYQRMKLDDVRDLFAYLHTLPPVTGQAPAHQLPLPFRWRRLIGGWDFLFVDGKPFAADPGKSTQWNRGAYLVNGPGHCAECHSPRNILGAVETDKRFAGGPDLSGKGWVPNITQKGLADWSEKDIAYLLDSGQTPDGDSVGGSMTDVIRNTSQLPEADREAMAVYVKSLPPVEGPPRPKKK
jgi:mono/diheme cytochrome c family protein